MDRDRPKAPRKEEFCTMINKRFKLFIPEKEVVPTAKERFEKKERKEKRLQKIIDRKISAITNQPGNIDGECDI